MRNSEIITDIDLTVIVDGEIEQLNIPVPFNYDGQDILALLADDIVDVGALDEADFASLLSTDDHTAQNQTNPGSQADVNDALSALDDIDDIDDIDGAMDREAFDDWAARASDLQQIDDDWVALENANITAGEWPGATDLRTGNPTLADLDETIDHDLGNVAIIQNDGKAAFRAMREMCGASQAALASALGVSTRTVKRWETPGQPEPPRDARHLVEAWHADAKAGALWHVAQAEEARDDFHEAYVLTIYRDQDEFDRALAPLLAQAPSYRWQDAIEEARAQGPKSDEQDGGFEIDHAYTNFPGTRSFWRANAAARLAAAIMDVRGIAYGFAYPGERLAGWAGERIWVPRADVQRIETPSGTMVVCGMR